MAAVPLLGVLHSISIADCDHEGNFKILVKFPDMRLSMGDQLLADSMFPDSMSRSQEDFTYHIFREQAETLHGTALFRGHQQINGKVVNPKAILVLSWRPLFDAFEPLLRTALERFLQNPVKKILVDVYSAINGHDFSKPGRLILLDNWFQVGAAPPMVEDEFVGASLSDLVKTFRVSTMTIWYAIVMERRILYYSNSSRLSGKYVLATPLLVAPLKGISRWMTPTLTAKTLENLVSSPRKFIAGCTNDTFLFPSADWHDIVANISTGAVSHTQVGVGFDIRGEDRSFIEGVLAGLAEGRDEVWVRQQFWNWMDRTLLTLKDKGTLPTERRMLGTAVESRAYKRWIRDLNEGELPLPPTQRPAACFPVQSQPVPVGYVNPEPVNNTLSPLAPARPAPSLPSQPPQIPPGLEMEPQFFVNQAPTPSFGPLVQPPPDSGVTFTPHISIGNQNVSSPELPVPPVNLAVAVRDQSRSLFVGEEVVTAEIIGVNITANLIGPSGDIRHSPVWSRLEETVGDADDPPALWIPRNMSDFIPSAKRALEFSQPTLPPPPPPPFGQSPETSPLRVRDRDGDPAEQDRIIKVQSEQIARRREMEEVEKRRAESDNLRRHLDDEMRRMRERETEVEARRQQEMQQGQQRAQQYQDQRRIQEDLAAQIANRSASPGVGLQEPHRWMTAQSGFMSPVVNGPQTADAATSPPPLSLHAQPLPPLSHQSPPPPPQQASLPQPPQSNHPPPQRPLQPQQPPPDRQPASNLRPMDLPIRPMPLGSAPPNPQAAPAPPPWLGNTRSALSADARPPSSSGDTPRWLPRSLESLGIAVKPAAAPPRPQIQNGYNSPDNKSSLSSLDVSFASEESEDAGGARDHDTIPTWVPRHLESFSVFNKKDLADDDNEKPIWQPRSLQSVLLGPVAAPQRKITPPPPSRRKEEVRARSPPPPLSPSQLSDGSMLTETWSPLPRNSLSPSSPSTVPYSRQTGPVAYHALDSFLAKKEPQRVLEEDDLYGTQEYDRTQDFDRASPPPPHMRQGVSIQRPPFGGVSPPPRAYPPQGRDGRVIGRPLHTPSPSPPPRQYAANRRRDSPSPSPIRRHSPSPMRRRSPSPTPSPQKRDFHTVMNPHRSQWSPPPRQRDAPNTDIRPTRRREPDPNPQLHDSLHREWVQDYSRLGDRSPSLSPSRSPPPRRNAPNSARRPLRYDPEEDDYESSDGDFSGSPYSSPEGPPARRNPPPNSAPRERRRYIGPDEEWTSEQAFMPPRVVVQQQRMPPGPQFAGRGNPMVMRQQMMPRQPPNMWMGRGGPINSNRMMVGPRPPHPNMGRGMMRGRGAGPPLMRDSEFSQRVW